MTLSPKKLVKNMSSNRSKVATNPMLNPIIDLGFNLSQQFQNQNINLTDLNSITNKLSQQAAQRRIQKIQKNHSLYNKSLNNTIKQSLKTYPQFKQFQQFWQSKKTTAVFTAHPTFSLAKQFSEQLCNNKNTKQNLNPDANINLEYEHQYLLTVITSARTAYLQIINKLITATQKKFPNQWKQFQPAPLTIASWVGYDLDGRSDIQWHDAFKFRLIEKQQQLQVIHDSIKNIKLTQLTQLQNNLKNALNDIKQDIQLFSQNPINITHAIQHLVKSKQSSITSAKNIKQHISKAISTCSCEQTCIKLIEVRSLLDLSGLTANQIHLRINATQIHNGIRHILQKHNLPQDSGYLMQRNIHRLIQQAKPLSVNFATLEAETATALKQFILAAQIVKYIDSETPIRFLIAECEQTETILGALLLCHMFALQKHVDISPLFETTEGLKYGADIIADLLQTESYRSYVKGRKRLCIQTGFSDGGRFIGQIPCNLAIERLQMKCAEVMGKSNLKNIQCIIFNTHGESIGRGAHPHNNKRLDYVFSNEARQKFQALSIPVCHEVSFQGGDGFLHFLTPPFALAQYSHMINNHYNQEICPKDPFYQATALSLDFFIQTKTWHEKLCDSADYEVLLSSFDTNMLFQLGSRKSKRSQTDKINLNTLEALSQSAIKSMSRRRAIPHNAILQQLGFPVNIIGGIGHEMQYHSDEFCSLAKDSPRLSLLLEMVAQAKYLSSLNVLSGYARMLDAEYWIRRAYVESNEELQKCFLKIGQWLIDDMRSIAMQRLINRWRQDTIPLVKIMQNLGYNKQREDSSAMIELDVLHSIRLCLMQNIFILAAQIPHFSAQDDVSYGEVMQAVLHLDIQKATQSWRQAFPATNTKTHLKNIEPNATYSPAQYSDYLAIDQKLIQPIEQNYQLLRQISISIGHFFSAIG